MSLYFEHRAEHVKSWARFVGADELVLNGITPAGGADGAAPLDVSSRWYGCVAAHVVVDDHTIRGVAEMLSSHFLLVNADTTEKVMGSFEVESVVSIERRQEIHFPGMSLGCDAQTLVRTIVEVVVLRSGIRGLSCGSSSGGNRAAAAGIQPPQSQSQSQSQLLEAHTRASSPPPLRPLVDSGSSNHFINNNNSATMSSGSVFAPPIQEEGILISGRPVPPLALSPQKQQQQQQQNNSSSYNNGYVSSGIPERVPVLFVFEGADGAHFASAMELLWRRRHRMLSVRDRAMCRSSHVADFIYTVSTLPLDVECVLQQQQQQAHQHAQPSSQQQAVSSAGGGGGPSSPGAGAPASGHSGVSYFAVGSPHNTDKAMPMGAAAAASASSSPATLSSMSLGATRSGGGVSNNSGGSSAGGGGGASSSNTSNTTTVVTLDRSAVLRIDQDFYLHIIFRPESIFDALAGVSLGAVDGFSNNGHTTINGDTGPHRRSNSTSSPPVVVAGNSTTTTGNRNGSTSMTGSGGGGSGVGRSGVVPPPSASEGARLRHITIHLDDIALITHCDNQLRIVSQDGRIFVLGSVDVALNGGGGSGGLGGVAGGGGDDGGRSAGGGGTTFGSGGGMSAASQVALDRRRGEAHIIKSTSGVDVGAMTPGAKAVLDVFLLYASTACYQRLYCAATTGNEWGIPQGGGGGSGVTSSGETGAAAAGSGEFGSAASSSTSAPNRVSSFTRGRSFTALYASQSPRARSVVPDVIPSAACFTSPELYRIYSHYCTIDANLDGVISPPEFFAAIGPVLIGSDGTLPPALYKTFDVLKRGAIQLSEFIYGSRVLLRGGIRDRLLFIFGLFDTFSKGAIVYQQFLDGMRLLVAPEHSKLKKAAFVHASHNVTATSNTHQKSNGGVRTTVANFGNASILDEGNLRQFCQELFSLMDLDRNNEVDFNEFCRAMTGNTAVVAALRQVSFLDDFCAGSIAAASPEPAVAGARGGGSPPPQGDSTTRRAAAPLLGVTGGGASSSRNPHTLVTFGHPRWKEMVQILAGIEIGARSPEATARAVDTRSFAAKVVHNCSAWGNHAAAVEAAMRVMNKYGSQSLPAPVAAALRNAPSSGHRGRSISTFFGFGKKNTNNNTSGGGGGGGLFGGGAGAVDMNAISIAASESIIFNDYCPAVFSTIRRAFGISPDEYLASIGVQQLRTGLLFGAITCLYEMSSSGRSGSFFYTTHDNKYILKTIPMSESVILRKMLPKYFEHVLKYPNTLLTRFCGLHALIRNGKKMIFVVMANIFQNKVPVYESFDLKGSTVNRSTPLSVRGPGVALKDNDFDTRKLYMKRSTKEALLAQLAADSKILADHNLNDYSFLLGVYSQDGKATLPKTAPGDLPPCPRPAHNAFQQFYGGIECSRMIDVRHERRRQRQQHHARAFGRAGRGAGTQDSQQAAAIAAAAEDGSDGSDEDNENGGDGMTTRRRALTTRAVAGGDDEDSDWEMVMDRGGPKPVGAINTSVHTDSDANLLASGHPSMSPTSAFDAACERESYDGRAYNLQESFVSPLASPRGGGGGTGTGTSSSIGPTDVTSFDSETIGTARNPNNNHNKSSRTTSASPGPRPMINGFPSSLPSMELSTRSSVGGTVTKAMSADQTQRPKRYEVYFVGIIDILTDYGLKKMGEHYGKSILHDSKQVSCIPPAEYKVRFIDYLRSIIVATDDNEEPVVGGGGPS